MNKRPRRILPLLVLATLLLAVPCAQAQDDEESEGEKLGIYVELGVFGAEPSGLEYEPATRNDGLGPVTLEHEQDSNYEGLYKASLLLGKDFGELRASWYAQSAESSLGESMPGSFVYGQTLSNPLFAGFANDGLADGFDSTAKTKLSDLRFDFARTAFRSDYISGKWFVGVRRVTHDRSLTASYYALSPDLPPILPPVPALDPLAETAQITSQYTGRGIEGGLDFLMPIVKGRVELEAGFALGVLSGKLDSSYVATNWAYVYTPDPTQPGIILGAPYDILSDPAVAEDTTQRSQTTALYSQSRSTASPMMDMYFGVRGRIWKNLEALLGFRNTYYGDVGVDLRPKVVTVTPVGVNIQDVTEVDRSAEYQGAYFSVAYTF